MAHERKFAAILSVCWLWVLFGGNAEGQQTTPGTSAVQEPKSPSPLAADVSHARSLMQQGKLDDAIAELQALETGNRDAKGLDLELGTAYYKKSDYVKAIGALKKAVAADPDDREAAQLLGLSYYLNGYPADAIPLLEKVQTWFSRANVDAAYILGICYIQTKDYPQARKAFAKMFDVGAD